MAFSEKLAGRVRDALEGVQGVTEKKMFGGIGFMVDGKMVVGVQGDDLMVRVGPDMHDDALKEKGARPMDFTGRPMVGFLYIGPDGTKPAASLRKWVDRGVAYAASLPAKKPKAKR